MRVIIAGTKFGAVRSHETEGALHDLQAMVGGYIEACAPVQVREQGIEMLCNEEGVLIGLDVNVNLFPFFFLGTVVFVGVEGERFVGLTAEQEAFVMTWLKGLED